MNHRTHPMVATLLALVCLSAVSAQAAERTSESRPQAPVAAASAIRALSPAQLTVIRGIGRNVLAAKKSGQEDSADAAQLASLRASLDQLIAADLDPRNRTPITVQGQESGEQRKAREKIANLRESTRADARALAAQLRRRGELKAARARSQPEQDTRSAGLPIGEQRARLFERWAQKLDAALAEGNEDRVGQLRELRDQLRATKGSINDAPLAHRTPTLQAMPAGFVPPKNDGAAKK
jgi:hypothetical protein